MSEVQKPTEEAPAAAAAPVAETTPATTTTTAETPAEAPKDAPAAEEPAKDVTPAAEEPAKEEPAKEEPAKEEPAKEEPKEEAKEEVTPATDGVLGYKAPGLVKGFRFAKRYFWFSDEAVEGKQLTSYFQNEKLSLANPTAAWASQTGKGLLFFAKRAEDKAHPTGIINLAEITDVVKESGSEFMFKWNGQKHTLQAGNAPERASWMAALEAKSAEAKSEKETITTSDGYKAELEKLTKPPVAAAAASSAKKATEEKPKEAEKKEKSETETKDKPETEASPEPKAKSRSQSRKRASIFGSFLNKKEEPEEKKEEKKEEKAEEKTEDKEEKKTEEEAAGESSVKAVEPAAAATEPAAEESKSEEKKAEEKKPEAPAATNKSKRTSIFGNFLQKVTNQGQDKAEKETPAPKTAETSAVSSKAPQLGDPVDASTSKPIQPEAVTSPPATEQPKEAKEAKEGGEESTSSPSSKFMSFIKKEIKHEDKKEAKPEEKAEKKTEESADKKEEAAAPAESTPVAAAIKEKRRSSIFGNLGTKKEKKPETTEGETETKSPVSTKLGGLFRKPSKAVKKEKETTAAAPTETEPIAEGAEKDAPATTETPAAEGTSTAAKTEETTEATEEKKADTTTDAAATASSEPVKAAA